MVVNDTETLKGLIEMAVERHQTSARQLAFKAQEAGLKITYTTLNQLRSNTYKSVPGEQTLKAIAWLAGVDESVAFTAAGQPVPGPPLADELPPGADHLSPKSRKAVVEMVRVLVDLEAGNNAERPTTQNSPTTNLRAVAPTSDTSQGQKTPAEIALDQVKTFRDSQRAPKSRQMTQPLPDPRIESVLHEVYSGNPLSAEGKEVLSKALAEATELRKMAEQIEADGSIIEFHGAEALEYPAPPIESLAAHPKVKTVREQLDEQTGERDDAQSEDDF